MVVDRGSDGPDRTIGPGSGSNYEGAIIALTFAAIDIIVTARVSRFITDRQPVFSHAWGGLTIARGGIHERGVLRE